MGAEEPDDEEDGQIEEELPVLAVENPVYHCDDDIRVYQQVEEKFKIECKI